jgi:Raf kinase inhibitor-like YbhB/YbcL family protein
MGDLRPASYSNWTVTGARCYCHGMYKHTAFAVLVAFAGCSHDTDAETDADSGSDTTGATTGTSSGVFSLSSPDLLSSDGDPGCAWVLPDAFSCDGPNPEVAWTGVPDGTVSLLLLLQDPDAPGSVFPHWGVVNLSPVETGLAQGVSGNDVHPHALPQHDLDGDGVDDGALELENGAGTTGYYGSCPPNVHRYTWTLWALDTFATTPFSGSASQQFDDAAAFASQHSLGTATLCHLYGP